MWTGSKFGGIVYVLRVSLAVTTILAAFWLIFFVNWSNLFNRATVSIVESSLKSSQVLPTKEQDFSPVFKEIIDEKSIKTFPPVQPVIAAPKNSSKPLELCPEVPPRLVGPLAISFETPSFEEIIAANPLLKSGGYYTPPDCIPRNGPTAVIVPYRNRESQLRGFLHHMHPILQRQQLEYVIIIVDQNGENRFNRALLMNIGYKESLNLLPNGRQFQCYVFHDVDLLPEDDRGLYTCSDKSIHLSAYIDVFKYKIPYGGIFGGASAIPKQHFELINGFSNVYFGWGGEDDDIRHRIVHLKLPIIRYEKDKLRYRMFKHDHEKTNKANGNRMALLRKTVQRMHTDGINSLSYHLVSHDDYQTYTHFLVSFTEEEVYKAVFGTTNIQLK